MEKGSIPFGALVAASEYFPAMIWIERPFRLASIWIDPECHFALTSFRVTENCTSREFISPGLPIPSDALRAVLPATLFPAPLVIGTGCILTFRNLSGSPQTLSGELRGLFLETDPERAAEHAAGVAAWERLKLGLDRE